MVYTPNRSSIVQVTMIGTMNSQTWMNVTHWMPIDPPVGVMVDGQDNLVEMITEIDSVGDGWSFLRCEYTTPAIAITEIRAQYVWPTRYVYVTRVPTSVIGTNAGVQAPQNVTGVITWRADLAGRAGIGGMRIPGLLSTQVEGGILEAATKGMMEDEADFLLEDILTPTESIDYGLCIFHKANPATSRMATSRVVQDTVRTERRRTVGRGI